jgi:hypothetical protein
MPFLEGIMPTLSGLPGKRRDVEAVSVQSRTAAMQSLRSGQAATAAGDHGALNVWIDDEGLFRAEFMRRCRSIDAKQFKYLASVDAWLRVWFPRLSVPA